jgi:hypothetical protein
MPRIPFSDCTQTFTPSGKNDGASVGIPGRVSAPERLEKTKVLTNTQIDIISLL